MFLVRGIWACSKSMFMFRADPTGTDTNADVGLLQLLLLLLLC